MICLLRIWSLSLLFFTSFVTAITFGDPRSELQIRNRLSIYALALDSKDFNRLNQVFTNDVVGRFFPPPNDVLNGLETVKKFIADALDDIVTQHTLSTTVVEFSSPTAANSTTYLVANYIGQGNQTRTTLFFYGQYFDKWVLKKEGWRSKDRTLRLFVSRYSHHLCWRPVSTDKNITSAWEPNRKSCNTELITINRS